MPTQLVESVAQGSETSSDFQAFSITTATVINGIDDTGQMRVQVHIPWLPIFDPWVRVAVPMAGPQRGTFFIPQKGDEVLVAFNQGDIRESYVIGSVWNGVDKPPMKESRDAVNKRVIRTPKGLEILFDDSIPSITLTIKPSNQRNQNGGTQGGDPVIIMDKKRIVLKRGNAEQTITLDDNGISIEAGKGDIVLKAKKGKVRIEARDVEQKSSSSSEMTASGDFTIRGSTVKIN